MLVLGASPGAALAAPSATRLRASSPSAARASGSRASSRVAVSRSRTAPISRARPLRSGCSRRRRPRTLARGGPEEDSGRGVASETEKTPSNAASDPSVSDSEESVNLVEEFKRGVAFGGEITKRFAEARIDDRGLPIADALVVTTVPVFVATVVLALGIPRPSWLVPAPWMPRWRSLPYLAPALSHGAKLSLCWLPGALAARAYEREAYDGTVREAVNRTLRGGCFAVGLLILLTQFTIAAQFAAKGQPPPNLGDGYETDLVLNAAASELIADAAFECVALLAWRVVRCKSPIPPDDDRTW